jgi:hypothetical protein
MMPGQQPIDWDAEGPGVKVWHYSTIRGVFAREGIV